MEHSKEWYVQKHREMWNWIADQIENEKRVSDIDALKSKWCSEHNISAYNDCLACEYNTEGYCRTGCLFTWGECFPFVHCVAGYYGECYRCKDWLEQAELARKIANLPVREDV